MEINTSGTATVICMVLLEMHKQVVCQMRPGLMVWKGVLTIVSLPGGEVLPYVMVFAL